MKVLLLGLGRANLPVARYLIQKGDDVYLYEDNVLQLSETAQALIKAGKINMHDADDYNLVISSPGFPPHKPIIKEMIQKNVPIIDEIEFTYSQLSNPKIIAVTGTNGKSTTTALISNILSMAGIDNFQGGNIAPGMPFSQALFMKKFPYYVLEISSFQLMRIKHFHPSIAILTNIAIDHLNWHVDFEEYKFAKLNIFLNQNKEDFAILNFEDKVVRGLAKNIKAKVIFFGPEVTSGVCVNRDFYYYQDKLFSSANMPLAGRHNLMNIAAAIAVAKILNIANETIERGIRDFKSLPHRLEEVGTINGMRYINNSMCTNEEAAMASFAAVPDPKVVLVGGKYKGAKGQNYLNLLIKEAKACVILGENADDIAAYFKSKGFHHFKIAKDMLDAVKKAQGFAVPGDVILLNPGFASFDYFVNFEERGEAFKNAVHRN